MAKPTQQYTSREFKGAPDDMDKWMVGHISETQLAEHKARLAYEAGMAKKIGAAMGVHGCDYLQVVICPPMPERPDIQPHTEVFASAGDMFARLVMLKGKRKGIIYEVCDQLSWSSLGQYVSPTGRARMFKRVGYSEHKGPLMCAARFFRPSNEKEVQKRVNGLVTATMDEVGRIPGFRYEYE